MGTLTIVFQGEKGEVTSVTRLTTIYGGIAGELIDSDIGYELRDAIHKCLKRSMQATFEFESQPNNKSLASPEQIITELSLRMRGPSRFE